MGFEEVKKEILDNARKEAKEILKQAESSKKELMKSADDRLQKISEQFDAEAEKSISQYRTRTTAETNSKLKKRQLALEKNLLNEVFVETLDKLDKLSAKEREKDVKSLVKGAKMSTVYCAKKDVSALKGQKPAAADITGGVILENEAGDIRIDLSYETLLENIKQQELAQVVKILFD